MLWAQSTTRIISGLKQGRSKSPIDRSGINKSTHTEKGFMAVFQSVYGLICEKLTFEGCKIMALKACILFLVTFLTSWIDLISDTCMSCGMSVAPSSWANFFFALHRENANQHGCALLSSNWKQKNNFFYVIYISRIKSLQEEIFCAFSMGQPVL